MAFARHRQVASPKPFEPIGGRTITAIAFENEPRAPCLLFDPTQSFNEASGERRIPWAAAAGLA
jgi:hypothetical protein